MPRNERVYWVLLALVCVAVLWFHARGADHHLPYLQYSNEASNIRQVAVVVNRGLEPVSLQRPTLPVYILAGVDWAMMKVGQATGAYEPGAGIPFPRMLDLGVAIAEEAPEVVVANRVVCAAFGTGTVWLIFLLTRELFGHSRPAFVAAVFSGVSGVLAQGSVIVRPEVFMCFFVVLALFCAARILKRGRFSDYLFAGLAAGFACSSKYNAGLVVVSVCAAHLWTEAKDTRRHRWLIVAGIACTIGFLLGTPYAAIDPTRFLSDLTFEIRHYQVGHLGRDGGDAWAYFRVIAVQEGAVGWLALAGVLQALALRSRSLLILLVFGVPYLLAISSLPVRMPRHLTPLVPVLVVCAVAPLELMATVFLRRLQDTGWWGWRVGLVGLIAAVMWVVGAGVIQSQAFIDSLVKENGRDQARIWIEENIPKGSVIAVESRTPWISRKDYRVRRIPVSYSTSALWVRTPKWYAEHGFEYLVTSNRVQGLYRQDRARYWEELTAYRQLNREFEVVAHFSGKAWAIAVLRIPDELRSRPLAPTPPWFIWSGPKRPMPLRPGEPWSVVVWRGPSPPILNSFVGLSRLSEEAREWLEHGRKEGLFLSIEEYEDAEIGGVEPAQ